MLRKVYSTAYGSITVPNFTDTFDSGKGTFVLPILINSIHRNSLVPRPRPAFRHLHMGEPGNEATHKLKLVVTLLNI